MSRLNTLVNVSGQSNIPYKSQTLSILTDECLKLKIMLIMPIQEHNTVTQS